jgi:hypothetical protein
VLLFSYSRKIHRYGYQHNKTVSISTTHQYQHSLFTGILPDNLFPGHERPTFVAEIPNAALGADLDFSVTIGAERFAVILVVAGMVVTGFTEKLRPVRS